MTDSDWDALVVVGRIARPHGLDGRVVVNPETDFADERFQVGNVMYVRSEDGHSRALTIADVRFHQGRPIVGFAGVESVEDAEALGRGDLRMSEEVLGAPPDGVFFHRQLVGCTVEHQAGHVIGTVVRVEGTSGASVLVVGSRRGEVLVPLAEEICPVVDVAQRRIVIAPPEGLLDLNR